MTTTAQTPRYSEPSYAKNPAGTELPWYREDIDKYLTPNVTKLLAEYSRVPVKDQSQHVHAIRDKTYSIRSYPTIGIGCFMTPYIDHSPAHDEIVEVLKAGGTFLDIGSLLGTDMRELVFAGAPSDKMTGVDIVPDIWDIGFEMYRDKETFKGNAMVADLLSLSENTAFKNLLGRLDVISISAVLHQWDWVTQVAAVKQVIPFSKVGTILVGYQIGNPKAGPWTFAPTKISVYKQNPASFEELWKEASEGTGTEWEVKADLRTWDHMSWDERDMTWLPEGDQVFDWVVRRKV